ncbi:MAG: nucleotidyl transferase AbiEii/AbiGii toxin family protein [Pseudonocardiaceae bacterium]
MRRRRPRCRQPWPEYGGEVATTDDTPPRSFAATFSRAAGNVLPYTSAVAFRAALKARFTVIAKQDPRYTVNELQRQFAYDRILSRCFSADDGERWVLKGAGALLARLSIARHSKDIDLLLRRPVRSPRGGHCGTHSCRRP